MDKILQGIFKRFDGYFKVIRALENNNLENVFPEISPNPISKLLDFCLQKQTNGF